MLEIDEARGRHLVHGAAVHVRRTAAPGVDEALDRGVIRSDGHPPPLPGGVVQVGRHADRVRHLRFQVEVADVAVAVADEVVHDHRHAARRPGVALVEVGRPGLSSPAGDVGLPGIGREPNESGRVPVVVRPAPVGGVELGRLGEVLGHHVGVVVALHRPGVRADRVATQPQLGRPLPVPARLPLREDPEAVPFARPGCSRRCSAPSSRRKAATSRPGGMPGTRPRP